MTGIPAVLALSAIISAALLFFLGRILPKGFLAAPVTSRSNHCPGARQIGGLAVVPAAVAGLAVAHFAGHLSLRFLLASAAGAAILAAIGYVDDRHDLPALPKLTLQFAASAVFAVAAGPELRIFPDLFSPAFETVLVVVFLVWFINMTNFMDGLDLMIVSGIGVPHLVLAAMGLISVLGSESTALSVAVAGALLGFAPFNYPPARIFLGDNGSLPIGFLTGVGVLLIAHRHPVAGLIPFLYFFVDSVSVLLLRLMRGKNIFEAHSDHAYQIARRAGRSSVSIAAKVALLSLCCAALAAAAMMSHSAPMMVFATAAAAGLTAAATWRMRRSCRG